MDRPYPVCDAGGVLLGSFADVEVAHVWAHERCGEPHTRLPLVVEDRPNRLSRRVRPGWCELVAWVEFACVPDCDLLGVVNASAAGRLGRAP